MTTRDQITQATSIVTMIHDHSYQLDAYYKNIADRAEQVDAGLITRAEAIEPIPYA